MRNLKKRFKSGMIAIFFCMLLLIPSIAAQAETAANVKTSAVSDLAGYMNGLINAYAPGQTVIGQLYAVNTKYAKKVNDEVVADVNDITVAETAIITAYVTEGKTAMDAAMTTAATSASEYLMITDGIDVPIANYGQQCKITMSLMCLADVNLKNVVITPITSTDVTIWPFEINTTGDANVVVNLIGSANYDTAYANRKEYDYYFTTRSDVLTGTYPLKFKATYTINGTTETKELVYYISANGASGSGSLNAPSSENTSTPRIIITGYKTEPEVVYAGDTFTMTIFLKNTSTKTAISNMQVDFKAPEEGVQGNTFAAFLPTSGSNTLFVSKISANSSTNISIELVAKADLAQKSYALDVNMVYEDDNNKPYTSTASVSIPIKQEYKFDMSTPEVMPASISLGNQSNIMFSIYNIGKTTLYNVQVKFKADSVSGGEVFVGKIEAGATGNVDTMLTGIASTMDAGDVNVLISYEDEAGNITTREEVINLFVYEETMDEGFVDGDMGVDGELIEGQQGNSKIWIFIVAAVIVGVIVLIIVLSKRAKKKKDHKELLDDLDITDENMIE